MKMADISLLTSYKVIEKNWCENSNRLGGLNEDNELDPYKIVLL